MPLQPSLHRNMCSERMSAEAPLDLSIVVPVYGSQDCLRELIQAIERALQHRIPCYEVILVNDYSPDDSWRVVESLCEQRTNVTGVDLRRNFGQDNAIITGLRLARGRYIAIMDDDMQHDPACLPALIARAETGADVVYADFGDKRQKLWKNVGSWINGKLAEWLLYKPKGLYLSPYKVIRREVVEIIARYSGPTPYIDGLLYQTTWSIASIPCKHRPRLAGRGNYTFWRSLGVSARLVFSFSVKPIRLVTWIGLIMAVTGLTAAVGVFLYRLFFADDFPDAAMGWASLMFVFLFVSGMQFIFFGVLGEYAGRTYLLVNDKPQTSIRKIVRFDANRTANSEEITERAGLGYQSRL